MSGFGEDLSGSSFKNQPPMKAFSKIDLDGHDLPPSPAPSSPRNGRKYALATELVYTEGSDQYNASSTPIYQVCGLSLPKDESSDLLRTSLYPCSFFDTIERNVQAKAWRAGWRI